jgi:hypothetical protein
MNGVAFGVGEPGVHPMEEPSLPLVKNVSKCFQPEPTPNDLARNEGKDGQLRAFPPAAGIWAKTAA